MISRPECFSTNPAYRGDPDALAGRIAGLAETGHRIVRSDWKFITCEHGGDEPDIMPQAVGATDAEGRSAIYVPLTRSGKIVVPRPKYRPVALLMGVRHDWRTQADAEVPIVIARPE